MPCFRACRRASLCLLMCLFWYSSMCSIISCWTSTVEALVWDTALSTQCWATFSACKSSGKGKITLREIKNVSGVNQWRFAGNSVTGMRGAWICRVDEKGHLNDANVRSKRCPLTVVNFVCIWNHQRGRRQMYIYIFGLRLLGWTWIWSSVPADGSSIRFCNSECQWWIFLNKDLVLGASRHMNSAIRVGLVPRCSGRYASVIYTVKQTANYKAYRMYAELKFGKFWSRCAGEI